MKKIVLSALLLAGFSAVQAQDEKPKLKDLLFAGKLKKDSSGVVRSTDDLSAKIDTSTRREPVVVETKPQVALIVDSVTGETRVDTLVAVTTGNTEGSDLLAAENARASIEGKSNTKLWREYSDSLATFLKMEVFPNKGIKKETYYLSLDYEIGTDGKVTVYNINCIPSSPLLVSNVQQFIDTYPPMLHPVLGSDGQPRKTKRKQNVTVTKE